MLEEKIGTPCYMAPEVINRSYNSKCDIWSNGVMCYILLSGSAPFTGNTDQEIMNSIQEGKFDFNDKAWVNISE